MIERVVLPEDQRCRVAVIGDSTIAMHCLLALKATGHEVVACFANSEAFAASARREGIRTYDPDTPLAILTDIPCDWIVSVNNARLISIEVLGHPARGTINFHDGPLPRYAGLYAPTRALLDGESEHAVTWHMVEEGIDTGDIIMQTPVPIYGDDTSQTLNLRCLEAGIQAFDELVLKLGQGSLVHRQQNLNERTYFGNSHWPREGMEVNWQWSAARIQRLVRALDFGPFPNYIGYARFRVDGAWHRLLGAELCLDNGCPNQIAHPGTLFIASNLELHIATSEGCLLAKRVTPKLTNELCRQVGHAEIKSPDEFAQIATWEKRVFKFECGWRCRMQMRFEGTGNALPSVLHKTPTVDLGKTEYDLACGLLAWALTFRKAQLEVGRWWTQTEIDESVTAAHDLAVASLLNPVAPVVLKIDQNASILSFANTWLELVARAQRQGPFFADLLERGGNGETQITDPATLPIQWLPGGAGTTDFGMSSWQIIRENGRWLASGTSNLSCIGDLAATLRGVMKNQPTTSISQLPLLGSASEISIREWESGGAFEPTPESFLALIFDEFTRSASTTAIETADGQLWTYGKLGREVASIMARLREAGVKQGNMVPIRLARSPELIMAQLAVMGLGCAFVPISDESPDVQVRDILERTSADVAIGLPLQDDRATTWLPALGNHDQAGTGLPGKCEAFLAQEIACVFFTSGSTGKPKGVRITHRGLNAYTEDSIRYFGRGTFRRSIWTSSVAFDSTLSEVLIPLSVGGSVVIPQPESVWSIRGFVESLASYDITFVGISTALWSMWMRDAPQMANPIPPTLRFVGVGGGVLSPELVEQWLAHADDAVLLCNGYGPTETTVVCTHYDISSKSLSFPSIPIGFPNRGAMIRILDEQLRRVAPSITGEIVIGGAGVADGYLNDPEETGKRFIQLADDSGNWYRTGDLGSWTSDGELLFHGRLDEQVKIHGYRVEPEEVSRAIRKLPGVKDAEVIAFGTDVSKELGAAVIRIAETPSSIADEHEDHSDMLDHDWTICLQNLLEDQLPRHAVPRRWLVVDAWPRTTTGKVDRVAFASRFDLLTEQSGSVKLLDPKDRKSVLQTIRGALARPNADPSESFFDLGGDSMAAVGLQLELESAVGKPLPLSLIYGSNTLTDIIEGVAYHADTKEPQSSSCWQSVTTISGAVDLVFMPGIHGPATLRHLWPEAGTFASIHAIEIGVEDYRTVVSEVSDADAIRHFADKFAQLVIEHLPNRRPVLVGYSLGGWFAFETAHAMERLGAPVPQLLLMEPAVHIVGGRRFRKERWLELFMNSLVSFLFFWQFANTRKKNGQKKHSGNPWQLNVPENNDEIKKTVDRFLINYHPMPGHAPMHCAVRKSRPWHLVTKRLRPWRYTSLRPLARGPFVEETVPLNTHVDFVKPLSKSVLVALLRKVVARHDDNRKE